jgi:hypothetical protein
MPLLDVFLLCADRRFALPKGCSGTRLGPDQAKKIRHIQINSLTWEKPQNSATSPETVLFPNRLSLFQKRSIARIAVNPRFLLTPVRAAAKRPPALAGGRNRHA